MSDSEWCEDGKAESLVDRNAGKCVRSEQFKAKKRPEEPRPPSRLIAPPNPQEREQLRMNYLGSVQEDEKEQLCRFWLRGLCIFSMDQCKYSHGISDLKFKAYANEVVELDGKPRDYNQKALWIEAKPSYVDIYEFQFQMVPKPDVIHSQAVLDTDRLVRASIREIMQKLTIVKFYELLRQTYPKDTPFTETFLEREYNRVGFHKIGFKLKYQYIVAALSEVAFEAKIPAADINRALGKKPPAPTAVLLDKPDNLKATFDGKIMDLCRTLLKEEGFPLMESSIRKKYYSMNPPTEPGLHQIMVFQRLKGFRDYLDQLEADGKFLEQLREGCEDKELLSTTLASEGKIFSYDDEMEKVKEKALAMIQSKKKSIFNLTKLEESLMKEFEANVKAFGSFSKFRNYLRTFLLTQKVFIVRSQTNDFALKPDFKLPKNQKPHLNHCKCEQEVAAVIVWKEEEELSEEVKTSRVIVVNSSERVRFAEKKISEHMVIGVDLEGCLRNNGYVELVQIGVQLRQGESQIFVFDVYASAECPNLEATMRMCLQKIMSNTDIVKVFHDSRNDSLALHRFLGACPKNVFDTAAIQALKYQLEKYQGLQKDDFKVLKLIDDQRQPGLNEVLLTYNAYHGINTQKDEMHRLFQELPMKHFLHRPIRPEYLEYAARDVEDLVEVYTNMIVSLKEVSKKAFPQVSDTTVMQWLHRVSKAYVVAGKESTK